MSSLNNKEFINSIFVRAWVGIFMENKSVTNEEIIMRMIDKNEGVILEKCLELKDFKNLTWDKDQNNMLQYSILKLKNDSFDVLLKEEKNLDYQNVNGTTALIMATYDCNWYIMTELLNKGANPDIQNLNGSTAAHVACYNDDQKGISILISHKADLDIKKRHGIRPLGVAIKYGNLGLAKTLMSLGYGLE